MKPQANLWPFGILLAFALFFTGIVAVIVIAVTHREYLVSDNYYEQEIDFQKRIDSAARARQSGATIVYDAAASRVVIGLPGAPGTRHCSGQIAFYRPSAPQLDREFPLTAEPGGSQTIDASGLAAGLWKVAATWQADGRDYYLDQKIVITEK